MVVYVLIFPVKTLIEIQHTKAFRNIIPITYFYYSWGQSFIPQIDANLK